MLCSLKSCSEHVVRRTIWYFMTSKSYLTCQLSGVRDGMEVSPAKFDLDQWTPDPSDLASTC